MAKLYVTEYSDEGQTVRGAAQVAAQNALVIDQTPVVIGAGSLTSAAFAATTVLVSIHTDSICSIAFGTAPTATVNSKRMAADQEQYYSVVPGSAFKVAVIANT